MRDQFLWGKDLMVAPVLTPGAKSVQIYFPAGVWFDFYSGQKVFSNTTTGGWITANVSIDSAPLYLRGGSIIPIQAETNALTTAKARQSDLNIVVSLRNNSGFTSTGFFYLDDGVSTNFHTYHSRWSFRANYTASGIFTITNDKFNYSSTDTMKWGNVTINGVLGPSTVVQVNGKSIKGFVYDATRHVLVVPLGLKLGASPIVVKWNTNYDDQSGFEKFCIILLGLFCALSVLSVFTFALFVVWRRFFSPEVRAAPFPISEPSL